MLKINYEEKISDNEIKKGKVRVFFCKLDNFPKKYGLSTYNHVLEVLPFSLECIKNN